MGSACSKVSLTAISNENTIKTTNVMVVVPSSHTDTDNAPPFSPQFTVHHHHHHPGDVEIDVTQIDSLCSPCSKDTSNGYMGSSSGGGGGSGSEMVLPPPTFTSVQKCSTNRTETLPSKLPCIIFEGDPNNSSRKDGLIRMYALPQSLSFPSGSGGWEVDPSDLESKANSMERLANGDI
eukprot:PhF_6_TR30846/c0_g1_i1/m.45395